MKRIIHILTSIFLISLLSPSNVFSFSASDYTAMPSFISQDNIPPNILILLDNSGSMHEFAYKDFTVSNARGVPTNSSFWLCSGGIACTCSSIFTNGYYGYATDCPDDSFDPATEYYGYFDTTKQFSYTTTAGGHFLEDSTGSWNGNFLNWLTMRRVDVVRKVLVGGKSLNRASPGSAKYLVAAESPDRNQFKQIANASPYTPFSGQRCFYIANNGSNEAIKVMNSGSCGNYFWNYSSNVAGTYTVKVAVGTTEPSGIIQKTENKARFGLMTFNKTGSAFEQGGGGNKDGASVTDWISGPGTNQNLVTSIQNTDPSTWTPLAESLYEATQFFKATNKVYQNGTYSSHDPIQYKCQKNFVLILTDGESTMDRNIPGGAWGTPVTDPSGFKVNTYMDNIGTNEGYASQWNTTANNSGGTYYLEGVAFWANTTDFRNEPALDGTQRVSTYVVFAFDDSAVGQDLLKKTAKYGGFVDIDSNNTPNLTSEWDKGNDGIPDTYFEAQDGSLLENQLLNAITAILNRAASGTAVSVLSTSSEGEGAVYQAYYLPSKMVGENEITWLGYLNALWIDKAGNLHEETTTANQLDFTGDKIVQFRFDGTLSKTVIDRYDYTDTNSDGIPDSGSLSLIGTIDIEDLNTIWEAGKQLALKTAASRKIYTFVDDDQNMLCGDPSCTVGSYGTADTSGEFLTFETANAAKLRPFLNAANDAEAANIINFIRGEVVAGYRDRTVLIGGKNYEWKLGNIVSSTPVTVGNANDRYDIKYGDSSYVDFYNKYKNRETIVYVGTNDGMLHAFYAGNFTKASSSTIQGSFSISSDFSSAPLSLSLGDEIWAYVPYDLLPHLQWLTDSNYSSVFYADLEVQVVDAKIFTDDTSPTGLHPGGWGTILIGGMKLGGGEASYSDTFDGVSNTSRSFKSAYFILDITDPTKPPILLGRFTDSTLGFTTSYPAIAKVGNDWFLVVGSGPKASYDPKDSANPTPNNGYDGKSDQAARIFVLNLKKIAQGISPFLEKTFVSGIGDNGFISDIITVDADFKTKQGSAKTYETEVIYAGETYWHDGPGSNDYWKARMTRIPIGGQIMPSNWGPQSVLFDTDKGQAITASPNIATDTRNNLWIYFGTGRYFSASADRSTVDQQNFYGIIDPCWAKTVADKYDSGCTDTVTKTGSLLFNSTNVTVRGDGTVYTTGGIVADGTNFFDFEKALAVKYADKTKKGWYLDYPTTTPSAERSLTVCSVAGGVTAFTTFTPDNDVCSVGGSGTLYSLFYTTGTAFAGSTIGTESDSNSNIIISKSVSLGDGIPSRASLHFGSESASGGSAAYGGTGGTIFIQDNTANIKKISLTTAISIRSKNISWEER